MKFTLSWLKDHLDTDASLDEVVEALTMVGLEVEEVSDPSAPLKPFVIAEIVTADKHPNADKLKLLSVNAGQGPVQVVCGAPNARAGLKGVFALPGMVIPATGAVLEIGTIRGVESRGMMCSERELGLSDEHNGIIELPADAPVGMSFADWRGGADPGYRRGRGRGGHGLGPAAGRRSPAGHPGNQGARGRVRPPCRCPIRRGAKLPSTPPRQNSSAPHRN